MAPEKTHSSPHGAQRRRAPWGEGGFFGEAKPFQTAT